MAKDYSFLVATKEGRARGPYNTQGWKVRHRIDGLTKMQAEQLHTAVFGRLTAPNTCRVVVVNVKDTSTILQDVVVGDIYLTSEH